MRQVTITFRPLTQWPAGRERTPDWEREDAKFKSSGKQVSDARHGTRWISGERTAVTTTYDELEREMDMINATDVVVQVDVRSERELRVSDSRPLSGAVVKSPGVVVSFKSKGTPLIFATDHFKRWDDNLRAIVLGLEGLRRLERYHITRAGDQYRGWQALPASTTTALSTESAAAVLANRTDLASTLGLEVAVRQILKHKEHARDAYRAAAAKSHPDNGGLTSDFQLVQEAKRVLEAHHGGAW